jgi:hypothetical protein
MAEVRSASDCDDLPVDVNGVAKMHKSVCRRTTDRARRSLPSYQPFCTRPQQYRCCRPRCVLLCDFWIAAAGEAIVSRRELPPRLPSLWQGELPIDLTSVRAVRASASYPQDNATPSARSKYIEAFVSRPRPSGSIANLGLSVRPPSTVWHPPGPLVRSLHWLARFCCRVVSAADKGKRRSRQRMHQRGGVAVSGVTRARCSKRANYLRQFTDGSRKGSTRAI